MSFTTRLPFSGMNYRAYQQTPAIKSASTTSITPNNSQGDSIQLTFGAKPSKRALGIGAVFLTLVLGGGLAATGNLPGMGKSDRGTHSTIAPTPNEGFGSNTDESGLGENDKPNSTASSSTGTIPQEAEPSPSNSSSTAKPADPKPSADTTPSPNNGNQAIVDGKINLSHFNPLAKAQDLRDWNLWSDIGDAQQAASIQKDSVTLTASKEAFKEKPDYPGTFCQVQSPVIDFKGHDTYISFDTNFSNIPIGLTGAVSIQTTNSNKAYPLPFFEGNKTVGTRGNVLTDDGDHPAWLKNGKGSFGILIQKDGTINFIQNGAVIGTNTDYKKNKNLLTDRRFIIEIKQDPANAEETATTLKNGPIQLNFSNVKVYQA